LHGIKVKTKAVLHCFLEVPETAVWRNSSVRSLFQHKAEALLEPRGSAPLNV